MKKNTTHIFLFLSIFIFQFCNQKIDIQSENKSANQELKILLTDPVQTLDPLQILYSSDWKVTANIFESLVTFDENEKIVPELVESFSISKDRVKYTFRLKENVYFQDSPCFKNGRGRKINSYDIKYTFERLAEKQNNFPNWEMLRNKIKGIDQFHKGERKSISGVIVKDSLTILFYLTKPFEPFLKLLASPNYYIIPEEAVKYFGNEFKYHPVGTGPFRISEFRKYKKVQLVKNENYYLKDSNNITLPYISSICYTTIKKSKNILTEFINNSTDIIWLNNNDFNKLKKSNFLKENYRTYTIDKGSKVRFWGFYFGKNKKVSKSGRKRIAKAFNRKTVFAYNNNNKIAESLVPNYLLKNKKFEWYKFSGSSSNSNFKKNIDTLTILSNLLYNDLPELERAVSRAGFIYKRIIKPENYYRNIKKIKPDLFRVNMLPSYPDPVEYYSLFYSKSSDEINLSKFRNKEYDLIYEKILYESNDSVLFEYYSKLEKILKEEIAAIYLSHQGHIHYLFRKNLKNINFKYIQMDFRKAYFE